MAVSLNMHRFEKTDAGGSFRGWLRTITENKVTDSLRRRRGRSDPVGGSQAKELLAELPDVHGQEREEATAPEEKLIVLRAAAEIVRNEFEDRTWNAFWRVTAESGSVEAVADELGMTSNAVYLAKSRVLRRLREVLGDLLKED